MKATKPAIIQNGMGWWSVCLALSAGLFLLAGCSSTPKNESDKASKSASKEVKMTREQILQQDDVKGHAPTIYEQPLDSVREAALRALTFVGCEIKKQEAFFVSGRRPNKFGLLVGSGGETVKVFLYPESETTTHVWVDTDMSFVGIAGQQTWNARVIAEMNNILIKQSRDK